MFIWQEIDALTVRQINLTAKYEILFYKIEEFTSFFGLIGVYGWFW